MAAYWEIAAHSAYDMPSKYKCLIVNLVFSRLGFWSGDFFLIAPFLIIAYLLLFIDDSSFSDVACLQNIFHISNG